MPTPSTPKDPVLQEHTRLVRTVEANLKVVAPDPEEVRFRASLLRLTESSLPGMNPSLVTRLYEAVCAMEFPKPEIIELRKKLQATIGKNFDLRSHRPPQAPAPTK